MLVAALGECHLALFLVELEVSLGLEQLLKLLLAVALGELLSILLWSTTSRFTNWSKAL